MYLSYLTPEDLVHCCEQRPLGSAAPPVIVEVHGPDHAAAEALLTDVAHLGKKMIEK